MSYLTFNERVQTHHKFAQAAVPAAIASHAELAVANGVLTPPVITVHAHAETSYWVVQKRARRAVPCDGPSREFGSVQLVVSSAVASDHEPLVEVGDAPGGAERYACALKARDTKPKMTV